MTMEKDAVFQIPTPILFAHRGGAGEVPENTWEAFEHAAINTHADILEFDVQLTKDKRIVVWHGPRLDNVWIEGLSSSLRKRKQKKKTKIMDFLWDELKERAWVIEPRYKTVEDIREDEVKKIPQRQLMLLADFLDNVQRLDTQDRKIHLNVELKGVRFPGFSPSIFLNNEIMQTFVDLLKQKVNGRTIVIASTRKRILQKFIEMGGRFPINIPIIEQLAWLREVRPWHLKTAGWLSQTFSSIKKGTDLRGKAFQTTHHLLTKSLVNEVHKAGGAIHVFLSKFAFFKPLIRGANVNEQFFKKALYPLLETGVDGIMTDYPKLVRNVIDEWKSSR